MPNRLRPLIVLLILPLFSACATFTSSPRFASDGAEARLEQIASLNASVATFKGTGSVVITEKGVAQRFRIAWAGAAPNLLRMEILASATPVESLAYDGKRLQLRSHMGSHRPYTNRDKNPSLERATGIPITLLDLHALLAGKFYVGTFKDARLMGDTLILRPSRNRKLTLTLDAEGIPKKSILSSKGKELYKIELTHKTTPGGANHFKTLSLTSTKGIKARIRIDRMIVNPTIEADIFTINP